MKDFETLPFQGNFDLLPKVRENTALCMAIKLSQICLMIHAGFYISMFSFLILKQNSTVFNKKERFNYEQHMESFPLGVHESKI